MKKINKNAFVIVIGFIAVLLYSVSIYSVNKNNVNLRNFKEEKINNEFNAFGGKILVKNIRVLSGKELKKDMKKNKYNKVYIDSDNNNYLSIIYSAEGINNIDSLDIKLNTDGYIFYDGLPSPTKISENEYEYLIPLPKSKIQKFKQEGIRIFFDNIKSNELEHHYIKFSL